MAAAAPAGDLSVDGLNGIVLTSLPKHRRSNSGSFSTPLPKLAVRVHGEPGSSYGQSRGDQPGGLTWSARDSRRGGAAGDGPLRRSKSTGRDRTGGLVALTTCFGSNGGVRMEELKRTGSRTPPRGSGRGGDKERQHKERQRQQQQPAPTITVPVPASALERLPSIGRVRLLADYASNPGGGSAGNLAALESSYQGPVKSWAGWPQVGLHASTGGGAAAVDLAADASSAAALSSPRAPRLSAPAASSPRAAAPSPSKSRLRLGMETPKKLRNLADSVRSMFGSASQVGRGGAGGRGGCWRPLALRACWAQGGTASAGVRQPALSKALRQPGQGAGRRTR
jgi:hypothetical protein